MFSDKKRFVRVFEENCGIGTAQIIVDTQTGVNYLVREGMVGLGITPLLDDKGEVVVTKDVKSE